MQQSIINLTIIQLFANQEQSLLKELLVRICALTFAAIYCYACDEDRNDNKLAEHLSKLGIDVKEQTKTEKTVQEMDLELNLNFTLSKILEEGKELIPMFGAGFTGLDNLGNSCYMNSVIQVLFSQPEFKDKYLGEAQMHLMTCPKFSPECLDC